MPQALLLVNRAARQGESSLEAGLDFLRSRGFELVVSYPDTPEAIAEAIGACDARVDLVIVGGGDGTIHLALPAVVASGKPLGILPLGTANDLARTLGIPPDPVQACAVIAAGRVQRIDLGLVNGRYFLNVANIGLGVRVNRQLSGETKGRWGVLAYGRGILAALRENRSFRVEIVCEGRRSRHRSIQIAVGNGRHYGEGMTIAADAAIDDHLLHLYSVEPQSLWRLLRLAPSFMWGEYPRRSGVRLMSGRRIDIRTRRPLPIYADGEPATHTPAEFKVVANALPVFVPAQRVAGGNDADAAQ